MSLFRRPLRQSTTISDLVIERYLGELRGEIQPDPLFRRRLRSHSVNRFVAAREGLAGAVGAEVTARRMGRLGRACLYASFTLGLSGMSVLAASQEALPGEALYGLKQRVEYLRVEILPDHLQGQLAAYALGERIEEMGRLAETGRLELATAMAPAIEHELERLGALGVSGGEGGLGIEHHLEALQALLERLPADARTAVENAINETPGTDDGAVSVPDSSGGSSAIDGDASSQPGTANQSDGITEPDAPSPPASAGADEPDHAPPPEQADSSEQHNQSSR